MTDEPFLSRWSRLKRSGGAAESPAAEEAAPPAPVEEKKTEPELELPPIDSLTKESDFSVFMKDGVPEDLKRQALRKLWASDPSLMQPEVMDLHMEDYSFPKVPEVVKTAWRFGKGMVDEALERQEAEAAAAAQGDVHTPHPDGRDEPLPKDGEDLDSTKV